MRKFFFTVVDSRVEVALTGTALPVLLSVLPSSRINFESCAVGESLNCKVTVRNDSQDLPLEFSLSKCAHFVTLPQSFKLDPNGFTDLLISFRPNQIGHFVPNMDIVVQGCIVETATDLHGIPKLKQISLCRFPLQIEGESVPVIGQTKSKSLSAHDKRFPEKRSEEHVEFVQSDLGMSIRVFRSCDEYSKASDSHSQIIASKRDCKVSINAVNKIAKPDDLAMSIRPSNKKEIVL